MTAQCETPGCDWKSTAEYSLSESQGHVQENLEHRVWDE